MEKRNAINFMVRRLPANARPATSVSGGVLGWEDGKHFHHVRVDCVRLINMDAAIFEPDQLGGILNLNNPRKFQERYRLNNII